MFLVLSTRWCEEKKHMLISIFSTCFNVENYSGWDQVNDKISIRGLVNHQLDGFASTWHSLWLLLLWKKRERISEMNGNLRLGQKQWPSYCRSGRDSYPFFKNSTWSNVRFLSTFDIWRQCICCQAQMTERFGKHKDLYEAVVIKYRANIFILLVESMFDRFIKICITLWLSNK